MRIAPDLGIPDEKPAIESIEGRWERKVSPQRRHALLQGRLWWVLTTWAGSRGDVGTEWRFYLMPKGRKPSSLVPDVAYVSFERMPPGLGELREKPTIAPDIAAEILSPDDRLSTLEEKIALYFSCGTQLVIVVDPAQRTVTFYEARSAKQFAEEQIARSAVYADLEIPLEIFFRGI